MGWTYSHRDKGISNMKWFGDYFNYEGERVRSTLLDCSGTLSVVYCAVEHVYKQEEDRREVWACVILTRRAPKSWYNFGQKEISEEMGPLEIDCPERILDLLMPTSNEHALKWRARCRESLAKRKARPRLKKGLVIKIPFEVNFVDGCSEQIFIVDVPRRMWVRNLTGRRYRLTRWVLREFEVLKPVGVTREDFALVTKFDNGDEEFTATMMFERLFPKGMPSIEEKQ